MPTPGAVIVSSPSLSFSAIGAASAQSITVSQANYAGAFTAAGCAGIVTTAIGSGTLTVTPAAVGTCTLTVSGGGGASAPIAITVTTTVIVSQ